MTTNLRIIVAQINPIVGDLHYNLTKHIEAVKSAVNEHQADLIIFPELSLTGYPPEDLLLRESFIKDTEACLHTLAHSIPPNIHCLVGHPHAENGHLYNACSIYANGELITRYYKRLLPNYGVFDEKRYFTPGTKPCMLTLQGIKVGILICEDIWDTAAAATIFPPADLILVPNASPFETNKHARRAQLLSNHAKAHHLAMVYCNLVGGQDELVFDGGSMVVDQSGEITHCAGFFNENLLPVTIDCANKKIAIAKTNFIVPAVLAATYQALVLSLRDYVTKNHFESVILGLSGGIDSALVAALATDALGAARVHTVLMPSRYTSDMSIEDATSMTQSLGMSSENISIESAYAAFLTTLHPYLHDNKLTITEENIQARCRATLLMALTNKYGHLLLTTGNRSELAVGYCTLYGDMAGGFAVLKDVPKTLVYELAHYRNKISSIIPTRIITRAPSAELAPNQKDEDSLPPYPLLDDILERYLNRGQSKQEIIAAGYDAALVDKMVALVLKSEYKRRQSAMGPHINHRSFGKDWRYPITNGYKR